MAAKVLILMALLAMGGSAGTEDPGGRPSSKRVALGGGNGTGDPDTVPREEMRVPVLAKPGGGGGSGDPYDRTGGDGSSGDPDQVDFMAGRGGDGGSGDPHHVSKRESRA